MGLQPEIEPPLRRIARRTGEMLVGDDAQARLEHLLAGHQSADRLTEPPDRTVGREHELPVRRVGEARGARIDLSRQRLLRSTGERFCFRARGRGIGREYEAVEPADGVALDHDVAALADVGLEHRVLAQPAHQHAGAAIDEAFGQSFVQRVRQLVLDRARDVLPVLGIGQPVRAVRGKGPGADVGDAVRQRIDVAVGVARLLDLAGEPVRGNRSLPHQEAIKRGGKLGMGRGRDLAIVGHLADVPQPLDRLMRFRKRTNVVVARGMVQHQDVLGDRCTGQPVLFRGFGERSLQRADRGEVERGVAPLQQLDRLERMAFERLRKLGLERRASSCGAEGAVAGGAAGPAGDLGQFGRIELSELIAVELAVGGKGDMVDVEIEAHADRVGGDEIFDVAGLIELDLSVARARAQRPKHHGSASALAADQLGDRIDLLDRERDHGGAARKPRDLLLARERELRQTRPGQDMGAGKQTLDHRPHGLGAEHQRLLASAPIEHAVGEDVAAFEVGAELNLVDGEESNIEVARHRLDGRDPIARVRRLDLLLAGDERDRVRARPRCDLVVHLARQQPQRQPDDAGGMAEHALDGEMRLAGVGRPEHRRDAGAAGAEVAVGWRREGNGHRRSKTGR